jgi:hypothetical protein
VPGYYARPSTRFSGHQKKLLELQPIRIKRDIWIVILIAVPLDKTMQNAKFQGGNSPCWIQRSDRTSSSSSPHSCRDRCPGKSRGHMCDHNTAGLCGRVVFDGGVPTLAVRGQFELVRLRVAIECSESACVSSNRMVRGRIRWGTLLTSKVVI